MPRTPPRRIRRCALRAASRSDCVLTNEDRGYSHNLIAPELGVSTRLLTQGKSQSIEVTVPDVAGLYSYSCGPHSEMMRGNIAIE